MGYFLWFGCMQEATICCRKQVTLQYAGVLACIRRDNLFDIVLILNFLTYLEILRNTHLLSNVLYRLGVSIFLNEIIDTFFSMTMQSYFSIDKDRLNHFAGILKVTMLLICWTFKLIKMVAVLCQVHTYLPWVNVGSLIHIHLYTWVNPYGKLLLWIKICEYV